VTIFCALTESKLGSTETFGLGTSNLSNHDSARVDVMAFVATMKIRLTGYTFLFYSFTTDTFSTYVSLGFVHHSHFLTLCSRHAEYVTTVYWKTKQETVSTENNLEEYCIRRPARHRHLHPPDKGLEHDLPSPVSPPTHSPPHQLDPERDEPVPPLQQSPRSPPREQPGLAPASSLLTPR